MLAIDWTALGSVATGVSAVVSVALWINTRKAVRQTQKIIADDEARQRAVVLCPEVQIVTGGTQQEAVDVYFRVKNVGRSVATNIAIDWEVRAANGNATPVSGSERIHDLPVGAEQSSVAHVGDMRAVEIQPDLFIVSAVLRYQTAGSSMTYVSRSFGEIHSLRSDRQLKHSVDWHGRDAT